MVEVVGCWVVGVVAIAAVVVVEADATGAGEAAPACGGVALLLRRLITSLAVVETGADDEVEGEGVVVEVTGALVESLDVDEDAAGATVVDAIGDAAVVVVLSGLLMSSSVLASGANCRNTFTVTLLASVGLADGLTEATVLIDGAAVEGASLVAAAPGIAVVVVVVDVEGEVVVGVAIEAGAATTSAAGFVAATAIGSISASRFTGSAIITI